MSDALEQDILSIPDDQFDPGASYDYTDVGTKENETEVSSEDESTEEEVSTASNEEGDVVTDEVAEQEETSDEGDESEEDTSDIEQEEEPKETDSDGEEEDAEESDETSDDVVTADEFFNRVTAPFKANGKEMQIKDPDDVIRLMQMGANYNKKMAGLKPSLKAVKMLERNKLLDEEKLSFLIDLDKKDPTAIKQLLKDSNIDPMDLDLDEGEGYKPSKKYSIDDKELALDNVIEEIRDTPTYSKTLDLVSNQWDDQSRNIVANAPELMKVLNDHMQSGIYNLISTEVEKERTLGRLNGIPDIEAYKQTGDAINARGGFNHLFGTEKTTKNVKPAAENNPAPKPSVSTETRKAKRRAASPTKPAPATSKSDDFNPLAVSDEEFMKQFDDRLL